ncbi:uncharacterized protein LOC110036170 [Phalaenopsis equestris]|uniref:uncharacterized protein LOC110036170 n=1 Tax=Phalaenopsis equestris TaxID=78828 RepID=UPI0009E5E1BB|nr:uncharacterized protein LOC110036170 [Phalaenopsis equestris]
MEGLPWWRMRLSYRNATIVLCFLNVVAAVFLLRGFFSFADKRIARANKSDIARTRYIMESEQIRRSMEPMDLIKRIKEIEEEAYTEPGGETKQVPKQTAAVDLSKRLNDLRAMNDANKALEEWRKRKMERARQREIERNTTLTSQT